MTKPNGVQMAAWLLTLTMAMSLALPRAAHASDAAKIIGAVAAGVILYELLDNDHNRGPAYGPPRYGAPGQSGWYRDGVPPYPYGKAQVMRGYGFPENPYATPWGNGYNGRWVGGGRPGTHIEVNRGPHGQTSIGFGYRDGGRR